MKLKKLLTLFSGICLILGLVSLPFMAAYAKTAPAVVWPSHISLSATSGSQWVVAVGMAAQIAKYTSASCTALGPTPGTEANLRNLMAGKAEIAWNSNPAIAEAWHGFGAFAKDGPQKWLRTISRGWTTNWHIVTTKGSGIKSFEDLKGKRWGDELVGSSMTYTLRDGLFKIHGMTTRDYVSLPVTKYAELVAMLVEKRADAVAFFGGIPAPEAVELAAKLDLVFIPLSKDAQARLPEAALGYFAGKIPAGSYKGQVGDVPVAQTVMTFMTHKDIHEEIIYQICKALWDHPEELEPIHPNFKEFARTPASPVVVVPYHDGAIKYYKEKGLWTDELKALQKKLLAK